MLNKLRRFNREYHLISHGDTITCAVSGGADSMALLWAMYLLKEEWELDLRAAHFNHHLRGEESQRDEQFVRDFCDGYGIPLTVGHGHVTSGKKGLEAAARDARYSFLRTLPGKIATAHTADDNAETVLMHLVRGTGLKGLGGITPVNGSIIRPLLSVTRQDIEDFLSEYSLEFITDSSNETDDFLRNRLRHHVLPYLRAENPRFAENTSAMALRLRQDESALSQLSSIPQPPQVDVLRNMPSALRSRALDSFLKSSGVKEPEAPHIRQAEALVFSSNPSARSRFPGGVTIGRNYGILEKLDAPSSAPRWQMSCSAATEICNTPTTFTVNPVGTVILRPRQSGDAIRLPGGTKSLKKLFIDRKIPAAQRDFIPVVCDDLGILGIPGIGVNLDRVATKLPALQIHFQSVNHSSML